MKRYRITLIIGLLMLAFLSFFFVKNEMEDLFSSPNIIVQEIDEENLKPIVKQWVEGRTESGVYLYKIKKEDPEINKYYVYSKKGLTYDYQTANVKMAEETLNIEIATQDAVNDGQVDNRLIIYLETKGTPKHIKLVVDGKDSNFVEVIQEK